MQLTISFSVLLAIVLVALSGVEALPAKRGAGMITLPLKRVRQPSNDLHPQILLQQHINRSHKRLARMTGRVEPSDDELRSNIEKRMYLLPNGHVPASLAYKKRYYPKFSPKVNTGSGIGKAVLATNEEEVSVIQADQSTNDFTPAIEPSADNSLGLDIVGSDVGYFAIVQLGTPPQNFKILMDSGSADFWVGSENCQSNGGGCGNHTFLGPSSSSSFLDLGKHFQITYGTGAVAGNKVTDNLSIAGLSLPGHQFGVALNETVDFSGPTTPFDGLMGLGQSTLSAQRTPTPVEALASNGLIQEAITSFKISRLSDNNNDGEITFGGLDDTKFDSSTLTTVPNINPHGFWEATMDSISVDGTDTGLQGRTAILDTGTTVVVAPPEDAAAVHKLIEGAESDGQGGFTVPCNTTASVALSFGGTQFTIDTRDLTFASVGKGNCLSGISSGNFGNATEWLVGDVFLKSAYFSTNVNKNQISLAKLV